MTAIEEKLVNSRAPDIAIYFRMYLCAVLAFIASVFGVGPLGTNPRSCNQTSLVWPRETTTRLAWTVVILNSSETSGPVRHLKCTIDIAVYMNSFGAKRGVRANPLEPPLPTGLLLVLD